MEPKILHSRWLKPTRLIPLLFVVGCGVTVAAVALRPRPMPLPPILVLPRSYVPPAQHVPLFARLVPATKTWAWLWHLKEAVCGKTRTVQIDAEIFTIPKGQLPELRSVPALSATSPDWPGLRIWPMDRGQLTTLRLQLKTLPGAQMLNSPRVFTGDGIDASLFVGNTVVLNGTTNDVGLQLTCLTQIRKDVTDLTTLATYQTTITNPLASTPADVTTATVWIRTNLAIKARFQIPKNQGVFLLQSPTDSNGPDAMGFILSTKL